MSSPSTSSSKIRKRRFQIEFFWATPYSVVVGYQRFRCPWQLHLQDESLKGSIHHQPFFSPWNTQIFPFLNM
jgi:hypothetical protein